MTRMGSTIIVLKGERPRMWNDVYAGMHYSKRAKESRRVHALIRAHIDLNKPPYDCRVDIHMVVYFKSRPFDPSNIPLKLYEDGLKSWVIKDDTRKEVRKISAQSEVDKDNPRVELIITPVVMDTAGQHMTHYVTDQDCHLSGDNFLRIAGWGVFRYQVHQGQVHLVFRDKRIKGRFVGVPLDKITQMAAGVRGEK